MKSLKEKILYLNELCDNTLGITKYGKDWVLHSYQEDSLLESGWRGHPDLETAIDNAIEFCEIKRKEAKNNGESKSPTA